MYGKELGVTEHGRHTNKSIFNAGDNGHRSGIYVFPSAQDLL